MLRVGLGSRVRLLLAMAILVAFILPGLAEGGVSRWVDRNGVVHYSNAGQRAAAAPASDRAAQVDEILERSGLTRQLKNVPALVKSFLLHCGFEAQLLQQWRVAEIVQRAFDADALYDALQKGLLLEFTPSELSTFIAWYRSPFAQTMTGLMVVATSPESGQAMRRSAAELAMVRLPQSRRALTERLNAALEGTELWLDVALTVVVNSAPAHQLPQEQRSTGSFEQMVQQKRAQFLSMAKLNTVIGTLFAYRSVSEAELQQFTEFWESTLGRRFTRAVHKSLLEGVDTLTTIAASEISAAVGVSLIPTEEPPRTLMPAEEWALAASALLAERNGHRHDLLGGIVATEPEVKRWKYRLRNWWSVNNRTDLLMTLKWLNEEGHRKYFEQVGAELTALSAEQQQALMDERRTDASLDQHLRMVEQHAPRLGAKSLLGWDLSRYISLCRWGYLVGYLSEAEAWERILPAAQRLQQTFDSWLELGENYLIGREFWSPGETARNGHLYQEAYLKLLASPQSPWKRSPWTMNPEPPPE
jgi:hypothetical protein